MDRYGGEINYSNHVKLKRKLRNSIKATIKRLRDQGSRFVDCENLNGKQLGKFCKA